MTTRLKSFVPDAPARSTGLKSFVPDQAMPESFVPDSVETTPLAQTLAAGVGVRQGDYGPLSQLAADYLAPTAPRTVGGGGEFRGGGAGGWWPTPGADVLTAGPPVTAIQRAKQAIRERTGYFEPPIYGGPIQRAEHPLRTIGGAGAFVTAEALSGLGLNVPDIVANKITGAQGLAEAVNKLTGFRPTDKEISGAENAEFMAGLTTAGGITGKLVGKIAARRALKTMLGAGLTFGTRKTAEEVADKITRNDPIDIEGMHFEGGVGVLFGAGEEGVRQLARFIRGVSSPKAIELWRPQPTKRMTPTEFRDWSHEQARREVTEAARGASARPNDPEAQARWQEVRAKYAGLAPEPAPAKKPIAPPTATREVPAEVPTEAEAGVKEVQRGKQPAPIVPVEGGPAPVAVRPPEVVAPAQVERPVPPVVTPKPAEAAPVVAAPTGAEANQPWTERKSLRGEYDEQWTPAQFNPTNGQWEVNDRVTGETHRVETHEISLPEFLESATRLPDVIKGKDVNAFAVWAGSVQKNREGQLKIGGRWYKVGEWDAPLRKRHMEIVREAVEQNKPVPRAVLEEYKSELWAAEALAKMEQPAAEEIVGPEKGREVEKQTPQQWISRVPLNEVFARTEPQETADESTSHQEYRLRKYDPKTDVQLIGKAFASKNEVVLEKRTVTVTPEGAESASEWVAWSHGPTKQRAVVEVQKDTEFQRAMQRAYGATEQPAPTAVQPTTEPKATAAPGPIAEYNESALKRALEKPTKITAKPTEVDTEANHRAAEFATAIEPGSEQYIVPQWRIKIKGKEKLIASAPYLQAAGLERGKSLNRWRKPAAPPAKPSGEAPAVRPGFAGFGRPKAKGGLGGPLRELGGVPREPPGLTKAEVEHLGKREAEALREAQAKGAKIGYKLGQRHGLDEARTAIYKIALAQKLENDHRNEAIDIVTEHLPKAKQGAYIRRIVKATTQRRVARIMDAIQKYLAKAEQKAAVRSLKATVKEIRSKHRRGETPLAAMEADIRDRLMAVLDKYDMAKLSEEKAEELAVHEEFVHRIAGTVADAFADWEHLNAKGEDILLTPDSRWNDLKRLSKTPIADLDAEDIKAIEENLKHLIWIQEARNEARHQARVYRLSKAITDSTNDELLTKPEKATGEIAEPGRLRRFFSVENSQLRTLVRRLCGKQTAATERILMDNLAEGARKVAEKKKEWVLAARERFAKIVSQIPKGQRLEDTVRVRLGGKDLTLTYDQLFSLWLHTEADGNLRRLLRSKGMDAWGPHGRPMRTGKITLEELQAAMAKLPDVYRQLGEVYFQFNREFQAPAVNQVSVDWQGFPIANFKRYWPFPRDLGRVPSGPRVEMESAYEAKGRYKPRTGGVARFRLVPFTSQFMRGMDMDASYYGLTIPLQEARTMLADEKWQKKVKDNAGATVLNAIVTLLRRKEGLITEESIAEQFAGRVLGRAGKGALSLRPTGSVIQIAGVPAAFEMIEPKYFAGLSAPTPAEIRHLEDLSPSLWLRWQANQFDYVLGAVAARNAFDHLVMGKMPVTDRLVRHYTWGDQVQVHYVWQAAQRKVEAEKGFKRGTPENEAEAVKLVERAMETQGQWDVLYRSTLTSSPNVFLRGSLMFQSPRLSQYNVLLRALDDLHKGRIGPGEFSQRTSGIGLCSILQTAIRRLFRWGVRGGFILLMLGLGKKDEEEAKALVARETKTDLLRLPADAAWDMVGLPAFGQVFSTIGQEAIRKAQGKRFIGKPGDYRTGNIFGDLALDGLTVAGDVGTLVGQMATGEKYKKPSPKAGKPKWVDSVKPLIQDAAAIGSYFTGLPYGGPAADIVWPIQAVERDADKLFPYRKKTDTQLYQLLKDNVYKETGAVKTKTGTYVFHTAGTPQKGQEERVRQIREELQRRKTRSK